MVAYQDFVALSQSGDSEARGQAAHLAAQAYLRHTGPADEHAALYAALIGFLDDPSVRVRAALAYGLLHAADAPRPILLALLQDSEVISRAVAQYSPALIDADLVGLVRKAGSVMLLAVALRERISARVAQALIERNERSVTLKLVGRQDVPVPPVQLSALAIEQGIGDAELRGLLLERTDLPASARLLLVEAAVEHLRRARIVKGAIAAPRLERLLRDAMDSALTAIGETEAEADSTPFAAELVESEKLSARVMLHAVVNGHVLFFADCLATLAAAPREKVFSLLETGSRPALNALLVRCGLSQGVCNLIARLIFHARAADLADDVAARHFVVTALTEELIVEHEGVIPPELEDAFAYLSEQNVILARRAARGVMSAFAGDVAGDRAMPALLPDEQRLALPAA
ncbi:MAG: hypothetical protein BGO82_19375 [Devosia sp. 67-54]|uniref:DUF2336 domain-containing protein n=1 Tax=unclassified Devosia TaxID=196773 RepID=UPI000967CD23|nr:MULTISPECIES: DUF2336 domain-containing protein [unclassified Devosia]MBN9306254.1 DUF2336 domain-containing protein [Devosia sp.]OJX18328.1 MAG: hypothetical protein BGO82_19375 [Devosia sp. 67-54]